MNNNEQLLRRAQEGDKGAKEALVSENLGLVHHIVKRFIGRGVETEDLFQIGCIGLLKAVEHFDLEFGVQFSTYAVPMIQGEIKRFLRDDGMIKVSRSIKENSVRISRAVNEFVQLRGREPTVLELCDMTALSKEDIVMAMEATTDVESLYKTTAGKEGNEQFLLDKLQGCTNEEERIIDTVLLEQLLDTLSEVEKELVKSRYFENKTQVQVALEMKISQVQVSRLEKKILMGLRKIADP